MESNGISKVTSQSEVEFTSVRYKDEVFRGNYSKVRDDDISVFQDIVGEEGVCRNLVELESHNTDYYHLVKGKAIIHCKL